MGRLAAGLAHDFNNLLTVITGHSQLLLRRLPPADPLCSGLDVIERTAASAARLTMQLLAFSRKQILAPAVLDLNDVVPRMAEMLRRLIGEDVNLMFKPAPRLGRVAVDPGQLEQVIVNLVVNARDAMPNGGQISLETANVEVSENSARGYAGAAPGSYVMLVVSDTGTGMDAETRAHIFEPFFTTKELGKGTGLGLATVYGIVRQSGGNIWVESEPGRGSTFRIYLPRVDGVPEQVVEAVSPRPARGIETILVVEDQNEVRALVQRILEDCGYVVLSAGVMADAFRIVERHSGPIHLLLTDMVMPQMNGVVLAERLVSLRPDMAVLYMSGYTDCAVFDHGRFIQKPFSPDALARKVRGVLDSRAGSERDVRILPNVLLEAGSPPPDQGAGQGEPGRQQVGRYPRRVGEFAKRAQDRLQRVGVFLEHLAVPGAERENRPGEAGALYLGGGTREPAGRGGRAENGRAVLRTAVPSTGPLSRLCSTPPSAHCCDAIRGRLEQEVGFADYGKYAREQLIEGLRLLQRDGGEIELPDGTILRSEDIGDLAEHVRRRFPEPGPQSQAPGGSLSATQNTSLARILENMPGTVAPDSTTSPDATVSPQLTRLPPALSARVHALLNRQPGQELMPDEAANV